MSESVIIQNLSKTYPGVKALDGISCKINQGEIFGFIGPDGAGKTTLFRILTSLLIPDEGMATVDGDDVVKDYKSIRSKVGYSRQILSVSGFIGGGKPQILCRRFQNYHCRKLSPYRGYLQADRTF